MDAVAIVIPVLNEATTLPRLARNLSILEPAPNEILVIDGGSTDGTVGVAERLGLRVIVDTEGRRGSQLNRGVREVSSPIVCLLHADTLLPDDAVAVIRATLANPKVALAGFTALLCGAERVRWLTSFHNWIKTWYAPLLFRPLFFLRGGRLLFGDHAMFFRRADYLAVGGCDPGLVVMEEADLCARMGALGRVRLVNRIVLTSDRRVAAWGEWRTNWVYLKVGVLWAIGLRRRLARYYPPVR